MTGHLCRPQHNMVSVSLVSLSPFLLPPMPWSFLSLAKSHFMLSEHTEALALASLLSLPPTEGQNIDICCPSSILVTSLRVRHAFPKAIWTPFIPSQGLDSRTLFSPNFIRSFCSPQAVFTLVEVNKKASTSFKNIYFYTYCGLLSEGLGPRNARIKAVLMSYSIYSTCQESQSSRGISAKLTKVWKQVNALSGLELLIICGLKITAQTA